MLNSQLPKIIVVVHLAISLFVLYLEQAAGQSEYIPFVVPGDDALPTVTSQSRLIPAPVADEFVTVKDGKFFVGDRRLKFWGFNLCFGANFPTHEQADRIVPHFAKLGVNALRFHHMDMLDAPDGIWYRQSDGKRVVDPVQVDRLDYFLARLHEYGIYANLNLHVSRTLTEAEGFPELKSGPWWSMGNKWVMYYDRNVQRELKDFCRVLLTHRNPYRQNLRRVDDPGIAVLEMMNENYFARQGIDLLPYLPDCYVQSFKQAWNEWLAERYRSTEKLRTAWKADQVRLGESLVSPARWNEQLEGWELSRGDEAVVCRFGFQTPVQVSQTQPDQFAIRLEPKMAFEQAHFLQLSNRGISVEKGVPYTLSFWVRSDAERTFNFEVATVQGDQWRPLGVFETGLAKPEWVQVQRIFFPEETIQDNAYLAFSIGTDATPIQFAGVTLRRGAATSELPPEQSLEKQSIGVPEAGWPLQAHQDLKQFLVDTERKWILEFKQYLRDLGAKVPITASQENYHAEGILAETVDYIDLHNYWNHPTFPAGRDFNQTDYRVGNEPMEADPTKSSWPMNSLLMRTGWRYHGMPFTLSEWNHAEPSDVSSGAVMTGAALGALQDWDGIFFFDYESGTSVWFKDHFNNFFSFNSQPVKLAAFTVAGNIFLRGDLEPLPEKLSGTFANRLDGRLAFQYRLGVDPLATEAQSDSLPTGMRFSTADRRLIWDATNTAKGHLMIDTPKTQGAWGLIGNSSFETADCSLKVGNVMRNYATVIATAMDDLPLCESRSILLLASSGAENSQMKWNSDRTSVSDRWGTGPTLVNLVPATIELRHRAAKKCKVFALDGKGKRIGEMRVDSTAERLMFRTGERSLGTIWYEVCVE